MSASLDLQGKSENSHTVTGTGVYTGYLGFVCFLIACEITVLV